MKNRDIGDAPSRERDKSDASLRLSRADSPDAPVQNGDSTRGDASRSVTGDSLFHGDRPEKQRLTHSDRADLRIERIDQREHRVLGLPRVDGFEKSGVMTNEEVKQHIIETYPEKHVNNITMEDVKYTDLYLKESGETELGHWEEEQKVSGLEVYDKRIEINRDHPLGIEDTGRMKETISHEVGHQIERAYLSEGSRSEWNELREKAPIENCVSDYARTNSSEDFAETYRAYIHEPAHLQEKSPEKFAFMRDKVFEGREYENR